MKTTQHLIIEGMSCGHCVAAVERALSRTEGVEVKDVHVGEANVVVDDAMVTTEQLERSISNAGFQLTSIVLAALTLLVIVGCSGTTSGPAPVKARLRTVHAAYDAPAVDTRLDGVITNGSVSYGVSSGYASADPGARKITITSAGATTPLISADATFDEGANYSVFVFGPAATISATFAGDDLLTSGKARIRFVHGCPDVVESIDLHTVSAANPPLLTGVRYRTLSTYAAVDAGEVRIALTAASSTTPLITYEPVTVAANVSYTIVLMGTSNKGDAYPMVARMYADSGAGTASVDLVEHLEKGLVSAVHAVSDGPAVDVSVDGTKLITGLAYPQASAYQLLDPGVRSISVTANGTSVFTTTQAVEVGKAYSVFAVGSVGSGIEALRLTDETTPSNTESLVRFVNCSPGSAPVDVITNIGSSVYEISGMQNIPYKSTSVSTTTGKNFLKFPAGTYTMKVRSHSSGTILAEVADMKFETNKIYTLWFGGKMGSTPMSLYMITHN